MSSPQPPDQPPEGEDPAHGPPNEPEPQQDTPFGGGPEPTQVVQPGEAPQQHDPGEQTVEGPEPTQAVQPPQPDSPGSASTQMVPPDMQPPAIPYTPPPSAADNPAAMGQPGQFGPQYGQPQPGQPQPGQPQPGQPGAVGPQPGGFDPAAGQPPPPGFGAPPPNQPPPAQPPPAQPPGQAGPFDPAQGQPPQGAFGAFPGGQPPPGPQQPGQPQQPGFGPQAQPGGVGGYPPQPGYGAPTGGGSGANQQVFGWIAGGLLALFGLVSLVLSFVHMGDVSEYSGVYDQLEGLPGDAPGSSLDELGLVSPGVAWFYMIMILVGAIGTLAAGVLIMLSGKLGAALKRATSILAAAAGTVLTVFAILLWVGFSPSEGSGVEGEPGGLTFYIVFGILILAVGVIGIIPASAQFVGLGDRSGGPAIGYPHPGQQPRGFAQPPYGQQPPPYGPYGQQPPPYGQPPYGQQGPPSGGFAQPGQFDEPGQFDQAPYGQQGPPSGGYRPPQQ